MLVKLFSITALALPLIAADVTPRVGDIEIYGNRKVSRHKIESALQTEVGGFAPSRFDAEDRVNKINGILGSRIQAHCCLAGKLILYVGVEERDSPHIEFHPEPTGSDALPDDLMQAYHEFLDSVAGGIRDNLAAQDLRNGYSLMQAPEANTIQHRFLPLVDRDLKTIDAVLRNSSDEDQRSAAAYLMQYAPRGVRTSQIMVNGLQWALQDPEDTVRENAVRALNAVAVGAKLHPEQQIRIEPTWFIELMNSPVWTDRHNASRALVEMTEMRDPETLKLLRDRALNSVVEMARWQDLNEALPAFLLAGRLGGLTDDQTKQAWVAGRREPVLEQALSPKKKFRLPS